MKANTKQRASQKRSQKSQAATIQKEEFIKSLLAIAQAGLWPTELFSAKEKRELQKLIAAYFRSEKSDAENFSELVERICLAKRYVARRNGRYVSKPQDWLNIHFPFGLSGTSAWLAKVNEIRCKVPTYNSGIQIFAKAVSSYLQSPGEADVRKYAQQLIDEKQFDLLPIYYATIINFQYAI